MKITKLVIKNLFGIKETTLDGRSVILEGSNGTGKTSIIDAIRLALTNKSDRDYIVRLGENEGEVILETDSSLSVTRRKISDSPTDYTKVRRDNKAVSSPQKYLDEIFTSLQLDPVEFTKLSRQEQNRVILNLIEFEWDKNWIKDQFNEIPSWINYDQHILKVLDDLQAEKGAWFQTRQDKNREIKTKNAFKTDLIKSIPEHYQAEKWRAYDFDGKYKELTTKKEFNSRVQRAKDFSKSYNVKIQALEMTKSNDIKFEKDMVETERATLKARIEKLKAEMALTEQKLSTVDSGLTDKIKVVEANFETAKAKLDKDNAVAADWSNREEVDVKELESEVQTATVMIKSLNEYDRMIRCEKEIETLTEESNELTRKIELARELPSEILKTAKLPIRGLTVKDGVPLIDKGNGYMPISNLSEGEQLDLCVDVTLAKTNNLKIILIDGVEKLSRVNQERIFEKCHNAGLQFVATKTTDSPELEIRYFEGDKL